MFIFFIVLGMFSTLGLLQACLLCLDGDEIFMGIVFGILALTLGGALSQAYLEHTKENTGSQTQGIKECQPQQ